MGSVRVLGSTLALLAAFVVHAADDKPGVVSHIKVLSDKVPDVSNLDAWKKSFIKDDMTDEQKAMAIFKTVYTFQHQDAPPYEYLHNEGHVSDAIKIFNVYGYSYCGIATADTETLARHIGMKARGWTVHNHVVPEIFWDGQYRLMDASLICYFPKEDGKPASVEEVTKGVADWFEKNPGLKGNDAKLREYMKNPGWKNGPAILTRCPTYDSNGWLPAISHGWYATMQEYDGGNKTPFAWEPGYSTGYQVNIQLRKGERLVRNWSNKGLHVNMPAGGPGCMTLKTGEVFLRYTPATGDLAPGRVGNGTLEYDVPLADGTFRSGALTAENLATTADDKQSPAVHVKDAAKDAILEIRMPSSYVYLTGAVNLKAAVGAGGSIAIAYSDSNGNTWKDVKTLAENGEQKVDLTPLCFRRYDYRLRFTLKGAGTGLDALKISHDIQHSQRPLPALGQGENKISFSSGAQEGTITIEPALLTEYQDKQVLFSDFKPDLKNVKSQGGLALTAPTGDATFKIATPGEMTRIRMNAYYRSRHVADVWEFQVSFDGGKTFKTIGKTDGPGWGPAQNAVANASTGQNVVANANTAEVPAGTKEALVRFAGSQNTVAMLFSLRIDADYKEPKGGFAPVKVTYQWEENGAAKQDVKVLTKPEESYTINCDAKPVMKSITLERAD